MKPHSLITFVVLLALGILMLRSVEGARKEKHKYGACPFKQLTTCLVFHPPECKSDWHCPKKQKCCPSICGIKCLNPVELSKPVEINPENCPVVTGQCKMLSPKDDCLDDSHCLNGFKCCKGMCGNSCVKPV